MSEKTNEGRLLYAMVGEAILDRIATGKLKPGDRLETPKRLARQMNVGEATVRHALQTLAARGIVKRRPRVGTIVARALDESVDQPQEHAVQTTFALIVPDIRNPHFACLARGVQDAAARRQIDVIACNTDDDPETYENIIRRCIQNRIGGLIMVPPLDHLLPLRVLADLQEVRMPVVTCWRPIDAAGWPLVRGDSFEDARTAVHHLVGRGYKKIGLIPSLLLHPAAEPCDEHVVLNQSDQIFASVLNGYIRGLQDAKIEIDQNLILNFRFDRAAIATGNLSKHPAVDLFMNWIKRRPEIDAVFCAHDFIAALLMHALARLGKRVPEDIGVVGGGNIEIYHSAFHGTVTTLDGHFSEIGESACRLLVEMRKGQTFPPGYTHIIPSRLIVGNSTEKP